MSLYCSSVVADLRLTSHANIRKIFAPRSKKIKVRHNFSRKCDWRLFFGLKLCQICRHSCGVCPALITIDVEVCKLQRTHPNNLFVNMHANAEKYTLVKGTMLRECVYILKFKGQISRLSRAAEIRTSCSLNTTHLFPTVKEDCTLLKIKNTFPHVAHVWETVNVFCLSGLKYVCIYIAKIQTYSSFTGPP